MGSVLMRTRHSHSNRQRALPLAAILVCTILGLAACSNGNAAQPPRILSEALDSTRLDHRAVSTCTSGGVPPIAAVDSDASTIRALSPGEPLADEFDRYLPANGGEYVAVCVYDADEVQGLDNRLEYFVMWETEWAGSGVLAAW
jgi:hypothetical protein